MPIYEYRCQDCGAVFEKFVRAASGLVEVECPVCHSKKCQKSISLFSTASAGKREAQAASSCNSGG
jgi:putative FmdB family regulatory protein